MRVVLDSSTAVKWFLPEEFSGEAGAILAGSQRGTYSFVAPDTFYAEFAHAIRKAFLGKRCSREQATIAVGSLLKIPISIEPSIELIADALVLALKTNATLYDALYVVIAIRQETQVLTADGPMCNAFASVSRCTHINLSAGVALSQRPFQSPRRRLRHPQKQGRTQRLHSPTFGNRLTFGL